MIQCLLTQLSKQTDFIQQQHYELQREVLIDRNNIQYKNIHLSDIKETNTGQSVEQMPFTNDLTLQPETTQADYTANIKAKNSHRSVKEVTTQVHRLFQIKRILLSLVIA